MWVSSPNSWSYHPSKDEWDHHLCLFSILIVKKEKGPLSPCKQTLKGRGRKKGSEKKRQNGGELDWGKEDTIQQPLKIQNKIRKMDLLLQVEKRVYKLSCNIYTHIYKMSTMEIETIGINVG